MKRNTSIIISITGITIIALLLIGFTYGYILTKVMGNNGANTISITTGNSQVNFTDLSESDSNIIIEPGTVITKTFRVESDKDVSTIAAKYSIFLKDIENEFTRQEDIRYVLYRVGNTNSFPSKYEGCVANPTDDDACKIIVNDAQFPPKSTSSLVKADEVIETPGDYYTYALVITYINQPSINQDVDQGKTFSSKVYIGPTSVYGE